MRYLLDTCTVSDFAQGRPRVLDRVKSVSPDDIAISAVTEMEIAYGLRLNPKVMPRLAPVMDALFRAVHLLPYDSAAAQTTAVLRAALKVRGRPIGAYDALIAGTAVAHGLVLVTSNVREFSRVEGLSVEDWRR
jgi:tRNA(fMet)-specific endonuclease VapC